MIFLSTTILAIEVTMRMISSMIFLSMMREEQLIQLNCNSHMVLVRVSEFFSWLELTLDSLPLHSE